MAIGPELIWDGLEDLAIRAATGYRPHEIMSIGAQAGRNNPQFRGDTGFHQFAAYEMANRLGPTLATLLGNAKEHVNLDVHGNWKGYSPIDRSADALKDVRNNQTGIEAAMRGEPNPVFAAAYPPDPTGHVFTPGEVDPETGQELSITYGVDPNTGQPPAPKTTTDALMDPIQPPRNPPLGNGGPVGPSQPIVFDGGSAASTAADAMPDPDDEFNVTDTITGGRQINELLAPDGKPPKKNPVISGSGQHSQLFNNVNQQESQAQTTFLQGGEQYDPITGAPTQQSRDTTGRSQRHQLADEYGQSAGVMPDLFRGGGGFGGLDYIPLF